MVAFTRDAIATDPDVGVLDGRCGAIAVFYGVVRRASQDGRTVRALVYEAYEALALREIETIVREAIARFSVAGVDVVHRLGEAAPGEITIRVVAHAEHRAQALDACAYTIDELKVRAAIWKCEMYDDGSSEWKACSREATG